MPRHSHSELLSVYFQLINLWNKFSSSAQYTSVLWHCWLGGRKGIWPVKSGCWFVVGDDLTGALHVLWLQLSLPPPSSLAPIKSRMKTVWCQLTQVHLENGCQNRKREYSMWLGGRVVRMLDLQSTGHRFKSSLASWWLIPLASCLHSHASVTKQYNWYQPMGSDALRLEKWTIGLTSHWLCVRH